MPDPTPKSAELAALVGRATPGPWRIIPYDCGDDRVPDHTPMIDGPEEYDAAVIHWDGFKQRYWSSAHGDERVIDANAAFIVWCRNNVDLIIEALKRMETSNVQS